MNPCLDSPLCCTLSRSLLDMWRDDGRTDGNRFFFVTSAAGVGGQRQFSLSLIMDHQLSATARISLFPPFFLGHFLFSAATVTSLLRDNYPRKAKKPRPCFLSGLVPTLRPCLEAIFQPQRFFFRPFAFSDRFRPVQRQDDNTLDAPRHRLAHETGRTRRHLDEDGGCLFGDFIWEFLIPFR